MPVIHRSSASTNGRPVFYLGGQASCRCYRVFNVNPARESEPRLVCVMASYRLLHFRRLLPDARTKAGRTAIADRNARTQPTCSLSDRNLRIFQKCQRRLNIVDVDLGSATRLYGLAPGNLEAGVRPLQNDGAFKLDEGAEYMEG